MSRPAQRVIWQRTVPCETCGARRNRPCAVHTEAEIARALETSVWTVRPHPARRRAEKALAEAEKERTP